MSVIPAIRSKTPEDTSPLFRSVARSHVGLVRSVNEDRLFASDGRGLWAVADGMGGHSLGGDAAATIVRELGTLVKAAGPLNRDTIARALDSANRQVFDGARQSNSICGSTVAGLHVGGTGCIVFWAGDSRVYRLRSNTFEQLSRDHSLVQEMVDANVLNDQQARAHPKASVITRAIGVAQSLELEFAEHPVAQGDLYLICSDGLSDLLDAATIGDAIGSSLETSADALLNAALNKGGTDNISVLLIVVEHFHAR